MKSLLPAFLFASLLSALPVFSVAAERQADPKALKIAVSDPICRESACSCVKGVLREYGKTEKYLEASAGVRLDFVYFEDEGLLRQRLLKGEFDGVIGKYSAFGGAVRDAKRKFVRLADVTKPDGDPLLRGVFIVYKGSKAASVSDLKGKRIAFGMADSPEKSQLAFDTLYQRGITVPDKKSRLEFYSCKEAALALIEGRADAAVISDYSLEFGCVVIVGDPKDFRVIGRTDGAIPFVTFMVDEAKVSPELRNRLSKIALSLYGQRVPKELLSGGFVLPQPWPDGVVLP